jgi:hypothetical protein
MFNQKSKDIKDSTAGGVFNINSKVLILKKYWSVLAVIRSVMIALLFPAACLAGSAPDYPGWTRSFDPAKRAIVYWPQSSLNNEILVKYYPAELLENQGVDQWLRSKLMSSQSPRGKWIGDPEVIRQTANMALGQREFTKNDGTKALLNAIAVTIDRQYVRLGIAIYSKEAISQKSTDQIAAMLSSLVKVEKADALEENRGLDIEKSPPKVKGIKTGGVSIKPGRYVGAKTTSDNEILSRYEVILYENGEYEFLGSEDTGRYVYSTATGRLDLEDDFYNSRSEPHREYCVYGLSQSSGKPTIYAEEGILSRRGSRLVWSNPPDRLSPSERKIAKAMEEAEKNRYKYVTNPGDGIQHQQIEAILYTSDLSMAAGQTGLYAEAYVLMKDGRVMDSMPVSPNILDVAKSRSREPDRWGWWKHDGERYSFAWSADRNKFVIPRGEQIVAKPIAQGTKLDGTWKGSSTFNSLDVSVTNFWGVHLSKEGRFEKFRNSLAQGGGEVTGLGEPMVTSYSDDEGTSVSVIGSSIGGGGSKKSNKPGSDRKGWYEFDGYNLTLKFDNGKIKRLLTFSTDKDIDVIWFEDGPLLRQ